MARIYYGGRSARGCYTHMHKNQAVTKKAGGYVAPLLEKPVEAVEAPKKADMNKVIDRLQKMQVGRPEKKRITFTF